MHIDSKLASTSHPGGRPHISLRLVPGGWIIAGGPPSPEVFNTYIRQCLPEIFKGQVCQLAGKLAGVGKCDGGGWGFHWVGRLILGCKYVCGWYGGHGRGMGIGGQEGREEAWFLYHVIMGKSIRYRENLLPK